MVNNSHYPKKNDYPAEFNRIKVLADKARSEGKEIVVVMGGLVLLGGLLWQLSLPIPKMKWQRLKICNRLSATKC